MTCPTPQWRVRQVAKTLERIAGELTITDQAYAHALQWHAEALIDLAVALTPGGCPDALTPQQSRVLTYVQEHIAKHGEAPTRKEIGKVFGFASPNATQEHLRALERKGHLTLTGEPRGIRLQSTPT